jgi:toxin ParE1/3/4
MKTRAAITFAKSAIDDLEEVRRHYGDEGAPEAGDRIIAEIMTHVERLSRFPDMGRIVPEFGVASLKEIIHPPFRIVYRRDRDCCRIVRIWRSERTLKLP